MKHVLFAFLMLITLPITAQNWAAIGNLIPGGIVSLYNDTISDELYLVGGFSMFNSDTIAGIGRWNGAAMTTYGCGVEWDCITPVLPFYPRTQGIIRYNNDIFVTGAFSKAGNQIVNGLARWDGMNWNNIGSGLKSEDGSIGVGIGLKIINNELYVFGLFDSVAGIHANSIAKFNGTNWSEVHNFPLIPTSPGSANWIYDVELYNNELYACGNLNNLPIGTIFNIVKWDGSNWVSIGDGIRGSVVDVRKMLVYKNELIVAGRFSKSINPNNPGENIGKWNGTQWSELGGGTDDIIWDIKVHDDTLYACGTFNHAGGIAADGIARWDGTEWCGYGTSFDNVVGTLEFYHDTLYIGGGFWTINGDSISRFAKWTGGNFIDTCGSTSGIVPAKLDEQKCTLYPNPFHTTTTLQFPYTVNNGTVRIFDIIGQEVSRIENIEGNEVLLSRAGLSSGMYFFKVMDGNMSVGQGKMVVE